jgi:hypothetical protein
MSYWNYRVIQKHYKESDTYQIHEVYYKYERKNNYPPELLPYLLKGKNHAA